MRTLAEQQAQFQAAVRDGADAAALLVGNPRGLQAYRMAYPARLQEALQDNYSALHQALGDAAFTELADAYRRAHPPSEPSIRWYGAQLAGFMARWPALSHPALTDLARLDWALRGAFDAASLPALTREQLAALPPDAWASQSLTLQPHVRLLTLHWAVGPAWHALAGARELGIEVELPEPEPLAHRLLVWREGLRPQWRSLPEDEAQALDALEQAPSLTNWLAAGGEADLARRVAWLQAWLGDGLIVA